MQFITIAIATLVAAASAAPAEFKRCTGKGYATFYNDNACTEGAGEAVSLGNTGCLAESGRHSIYIQATCEGNVPQMNYYSDSGCSDHIDCYALPNGGTNQGCWAFPQSANGAANSYKFTDNSCA